MPEDGLQPTGAANATDGIDVPAQFRAESECGDDIMSTIVKSAERQSVAHGNMAEEGALELRREWGHRGTSSLVVMHNRTAARLMLDRHSDRAGHLHEKSCYPEVLEPGSNGAFLHVGNRRDRKDPSKGLLVYSVCVYDENKGEWKNSAFSLAFSWETGAFGGYIGIKFESARERVLHHTKTKYDGEKILGEANVKKSPLPVFIVTFSQKKVEEKDMPLTSKIIDFFQISSSNAKELRISQETKEQEMKRTETDGREAEGSDKKEDTEMGDMEAETLDAEEEAKMDDIEAEALDPEEEAEIEGLQAEVVDQKEPTISKGPETQ